MLTILVPAASVAAPAVVPKELVSGLSQPVEIVPAGDGTNRLFVVEQGGLVRIVENRALLPTPFLDLRGFISVGSERGLLGLAFHPDYAANRAFYVFYTAPDGALTVARYLRDAADPRRADPNSGAVLLSIPHPTFANHNGGKLAFGPDGHLYISTGDGGGGGDPAGNAQDLTNLLGKLLRVAVDAGTAYRIPPDNPFAANPKCPGGTEPCPEIWSYGLRNPWKFSFDRTSGGLFIGDVGQRSWEEIDYLPPASPAPANFGWNVFEGTHCFSPPSDCSLPNHMPPVLEYAHDAAGGVSVTGGFRYRGVRNSPLKGAYVFGDFGSRRIWSVFPAATLPWSPRLLLNPAPIGGLSSFGEDNAGELYVLDYGNGKIWTLDPPLALSALRIPFPRTAQGASSAPRTLRVTNASTAALSITGVTASGDFSISSNGCSNSPLAAGAFCDVSLRFTPSGPGARSGELTISTNYLGSPVFRVPLSGNRVAGGSGDHDGDGRDDIVLRSALGSNLVWHIEGSGALGAAARIPALGRPWIVAARADFDGDGVGDLLFRNPANGQNRVWLLRAGGLKRAELAPTLSDLQWLVGGAGDVDGDGRADVIWRHQTTGENVVWRMDGGVVLGTLSLSTLADIQWRMAAVGDLNGDGRADLVWRRGITGANLVWLLHGAGILAAGELPAETNLDWSIAGVGDFDRDGRTDLAWRNRASGANRVWLMSGTAVKAQGAIPSNGIAWNLSGTGDYDGDGAADLLWSNASARRNSIWLMDGLIQTGTRRLPAYPAGMSSVP